MPRHAPLSAHVRSIAYASMAALFMSSSYRGKRAGGMAEAPRLSATPLPATCVHNVSRQRLPEMCDFAQCSSPLQDRLAPRLFTHRSRRACRSPRHGEAPYDTLGARRARQDAGQAGCAPLTCLPQAPAPAQPALRRAEVGTGSAFPPRGPRGRGLLRPGIAGPCKGRRRIRPPLHRGRPGMNLTSPQGRTAGIVLHH